MDGRPRAVFLASRSRLSHHRVHKQPAGSGPVRAQRPMSVPSRLSHGSAGHGQESEETREAQGVPHTRPGSWVIPSWAGPVQPVSLSPRSPGAPRAQHGDVAEVRVAQEAAVLAQERAHGPKGTAPRVHGPLAHHCCRNPQSAAVSHASPSGPGSCELSLGGRARSELRAH